MKTLIIGFTKLKYMPYMNFYLDNIDKEANDIHLLYWNRDCREEDLSKFNTITLHEFSYYQKDEVPKISKLKGFRKYRRFAKNVLRENCYDFIIVLHTLPGVLIVEELVKRYSGKYILDYRDFTYEGNAPFRKIIHAIVHHASVTFVSSDAFRKYLPADAVIYTSHNILTDSLIRSGLLFGVSSGMRILIEKLLSDLQMTIVLSSTIMAESRKRRCTLKNMHKRSPRPMFFFMVSISRKIDIILFATPI